MPFPPSAPLQIFRYSRPWFWGMWLVCPSLVAFGVYEGVSRWQRGGVFEEYGVPLAFPAFLVITGVLSVLQASRYRLEFFEDRLVYCNGLRTHVVERSIIHGRRVVRGRHHDQVLFFDRYGDKVLGIVLMFTPHGAFEAWMSSLEYREPRFSLRRFLRRGDE